jgi:hypothetical protein
LALAMATVAKNKTWNVPAMMKLGDDADKLLRKNGLNPEFVCIGKLVSIHDEEKENVGIISSSRGDYSKNERIMVVCIGNMNQFNSFIQRRICQYRPIHRYISLLPDNLPMASSSPRREPEMKSDSMIQK